MSITAASLKNLSVNQFQEKEEKVIFEWHVSGFWQNDLYDPEKKLTLVQKSRDLFVKIFDFSSKKTTECQLRIQHNLEMDIACLKKCELINFQNGIPVFEEPELIWSTPKFKLCLTTFKSLLVWHLKISSQQLTQRVAAEKVGTLIVEGVYRETYWRFKEYFDPYIEKQSYDNATRIHYLKKCKLNCVKIFNNYFQVVIEPLSAPSYFDSRVKVSPSIWNITLVIDQRGSPSNQTSIIIEGINDKNEYFMHKAEFINNEVNSRPICQKDLSFDKRSEIWTKRKDIVIDLLKMIETEKNNHSSFTNEFFRRQKNKKNISQNWIKYMLKWVILFQENFETNLHKPAYYENREAPLNLL